MGDISTRSRFRSRAISSARTGGITPIISPFSSIKRTSRARMRSFTRVSRGRSFPRKSLLIGQTCLSKCENTFYHIFELVQIELLLFNNTLVGFSVPSYTVYPEHTTYSEHLMNLVKCSILAYPSQMNPGIPGVARFCLAGASTPHRSPDR